MLEEDRATDICNMHKKMVKIARVVPIPEISSRTDRQTDTQTGILITILATTPAGKVIYSSLIHHKGRSNNETNKQAEKKRKT